MISFSAAMRDAIELLGNQTLIAKSGIAFKLPTSHMHEDKDAIGQIFAAVVGPGFEPIDF